MSSEEKARKHIRVSLSIRDAIQRFASPHYHLTAYVGTYTAGRGGQVYQAAEERSGETFWSVRMLSSEGEVGLKYPDVIVTLGDKVRYLIEVKWGAIRRETTTDIDEACLQDIESPAGHTHWARLSGGFCRVRGPAVERQQRYQSAAFREVHEFTVDAETTFLLVSDFVEMKAILPTKYRMAVSRLRAQETICAIADFRATVDGIPSFYDLLVRDFGHEGRA